jgi:hypothetical protein
MRRLESNIEQELSGLGFRVAIHGGPPKATQVCLGSRSSDASSARSEFGGGAGPIRITALEGDSGEKVRWQAGGVGSYRTGIGVADCGA